MWDVAARYAGEHGGFKVAVAGAYNELKGGQTLNPTAATFEYFQAGAYVQHVQSGLWLYGAYGTNEFDGLAGDSDTYYVKAGLRQRWHSLGHTVFYGEYEQSDSDGALVNAEGATETEFNLWGVGIVQEIDAAAMSLWLSYRNLEYQNDLGDEYDDFQYVKFGALINF